MNSLKKGEGVPLLNFAGGSRVPILNFEGCSESRNLRSCVPGSCSHFYTMPILISFCVYMIKGDDALTEISPFQAKWDEQKSI